MRIKTVAVCGAGTMGSAIAQHFCMKGLKVKLFDLNSAVLEQAQLRITASINEAKQKQILSPESAERALLCLQLTARLSELADVDFVVEAIFEDREVKRRLFSDLEKTVRTNCVLASNTSSFLISDLATGLSSPQRFVGVHYFYHAAKNKLVELVAGKQTDVSVIEELDTFYRSIDKIPIQVADAPGFAVNRFFVPWLNEATRLYEEGLGSIASIDKVACETFQLGMGPFALMNATGVPIAMHAAQGLAERLGEFYAPSAVLKRQVAKGEPWNLADQTFQVGGKENRSAVVARLSAAAIGIAAALVQEGVATAESVDLGARVGLRWAEGPFELILRKDRETLLVQIVDCMQKWGFAPPRFPTQLEWVRADIVEKDAFIIFEIPDRMNPLSEQVVARLEEKWNEVESNPTVERVFFIGRGKAFVAGADIKFFLEAMNRNDYQRIAEFTACGQKLFERFAASKKKTIAYLNGLTLGGGLELALSCQYRVATKNARLAFPETGIGIYPGLGGTQRTTRLLGKGVAKYLVATGAMLDANKALAFGVVDQLLEPVEHIHDLRKLGVIPSQAGKLAHPAEEGFAGFDGGLSDDSFAESVVKGNEKLLKRKAPMALALAMRLIDLGQGMSLEKGLALELQHLDEIFKTEDAHVGLSAVLTKTRPEFKGK